MTQKEKIQNLELRIQILENVIEQINVVCPICGKYKKLPGNGVMWPLCICPEIDYYPSMYYPEGTMIL